MTGSLQVKKDKYYMVINIIDASGKRKPKWISTGYAVKGNKKRAEQMLRDCLREYDLKEAAAQKRSDMRFCDWIRHWLEEAQRRVDVVTFKQYEETAVTQVLPYFEDTLLCDVTRSMLQEYIDCKAASGRIDGKGGLSPVRLRHLRNVLI